MEVRQSTYIVIVTKTDLEELVRHTVLRHLGIEDEPCNITVDFRAKELPVSKDPVGLVALVRVQTGVDRAKRG